jgi:outer membrane protein OmpA-like peptidoglycan-associated protein/opacity protein-like surface antigen
MKKTGLLALSLCAAFAGTAHAGYDWFGGRLSIGGGYGAAKPKLPYTWQDTYKEDRMWTAHMKYFINDNISLVGSYADIMTENRSNAQHSQFRPIIASVRYNIFHNLPISPYLTAGAGVSRNKIERPVGENLEFTKFAWQSGVGMEFFVNQGTSLGVEALYHDIRGEGGAGIERYRPISLVGTVNLYFGDAPATRRANDEAKAAREDARRAREEADAAKNAALATTQQSQADMAQSEAARKAAEEAANAARLEADRKLQESQAQVAAAQAEVDQIKQMVASKSIQPVNFETGRATLLASSSQTLDKVAEIAKKYPNLRLRVEGHTDSVGSDATNQTLSQKRADSVRDYLAKSGVNAGQISAVGFGEAQPVASNDSADGRSQNRRVEFIFALQ